MILQEQDNNTFTKEKTDVEKYLMRIIQRYFDTENNYSKASIESIIVESLTRFKRFCKNKGKGFLFSFNKETGHIHIDISSFEGEPAFAKRSAFNKDFGDAIDTVCEGNDARLSDARPATEHRHEAISIAGLADALEQFVIPDYVHSHKNQSLLDLLDYTGTALEIDLIVIEHIKSQMPMYQTNAATIRANLTSYHNRQVDALNSSTAALLDFLDKVTSNLTLSMSWVQEVRNGLNSGVKELQDYAMRKFDRMTAQDECEAMEEAMASVYQLDSTGSFDIQETINGVTNITSDGRPFVVYNITSTDVTLPIASTDRLVNMYFQYEDDNGNTVRAPLPMIFKDSIGSDVIIQCGLRGNVARYQTLMPARFSGYGMCNINYHDGKMCILVSRQNPLDFYDAITYAHTHGYPFIDYDPTNAGQQALLQTIAPTGSFYIGALYDEEQEAYLTVQGELCKFSETENQAEGAVYYKEGKIYDGLNVELREQLFDIPILKLEDYYKHPQIYYEVFKKGV